MHGSANRCAMTTPACSSNRWRRFSSCCQATCGCQARAENLEAEVRLPPALLGDSCDLRQFGGAADATHKKLQYLWAVAADPEAARSLAFFAVHSHASDGVTAASANIARFRCLFRATGSSPCSAPALVDSTPSWRRPRPFSRDALPATRKPGATEADAIPAACLCWVLPSSASSWLPLVGLSGATALAKGGRKERFR